MAELNYESLVAELVKPLVTHPEDVKDVDPSTVEDDE